MPIESLDHPLAPQETSPSAPTPFGEAESPAFHAQLKDAHERAGIHLEAARSGFSRATGLGATRPPESPEAATTPTEDAPSLEAQARERFDTLVAPMLSGLRRSLETLPATNPGKAVLADWVGRIQGRYEKTRFGLATSDEFNTSVRNFATDVERRIQKHPALLEQLLLESENASVRWIDAMISDGPLFYNDFGRFYSGPARKE